ncbi:MAG: TrkA C-terminal domain-containing protein [Desulfurococcales archaeon]|nr:TrkA C-terminal domain-containing protein [Desulfurococcales archaeon]
MWTPLATLLLIILFSIVVNKIATKALMRTGLSRDVASFQAQSAFSGAGFTTSESEYVVNHPVRRRIIRILILLGSAGLTSSMAALILTFIGQTSRGALARLGVLSLGLLLLYVFASSKTVDRLLGRVIDWALDRFTSIRVVDYESLLGVGHGYIVSSFQVSPGSWLAGRRLRELRLKDEGAIVLGIYRRGEDGSIRYIGAPGPDEVILPGDEVIIYGHEEVVASLSRRLAGPIGDVEHEEMVERQRARVAAERLG